MQSSEKSHFVFVRSSATPKFEEQNEITRQECLSPIFPPLLASNPGLPTVPTPAAAADGGEVDKGREGEEGEGGQIAGISGGERERLACLLPRPYTQRFGLQ